MNDTDDIWPYCVFRKVVSDCCVFLEDWNDCDHGDCDHGDCDHGDCDHGDCDHGDCDHGDAST